MNGTSSTAQILGQPRKFLASKVVSLEGFRLEAEPSLNLREGHSLREHSWIPRTGTAASNCAGQGVPAQNLTRVQGRGPRPESLPAHRAGGARPEQNTRTGMGGGSSTSSSTVAPG